MEYQTSKYKIEVFEDNAFANQSAGDTNRYDVIYIDHSEYSFQSVFGVKVYMHQELLRSALIAANGGATTIHSTSAVVNEDRLVLCCSDSIFCLSFPDLNLLWRTPTDSVTCFQIYKYQHDYIVHGEMEISRLNKDGEIIWQQGGADIFVTQDGTENFILNEESIVVKDWNNDIYRFDYDGRLIEE